MTILYENEHYEVRMIEDALDEDGVGRVQGYGLFNKNTGVREATCLLLGNAMFTAERANAMVRREPVIEVTLDDDVVLQ